MNTHHTSAHAGTGVMPMARSLVGPAIGGGLLGGLGMIGLMIIVMGVSGAGWATPLNLGMAAFVFTITPPMAMLPRLMPMMGVQMPPAMMDKLSSALMHGPLSPAMAQQMGQRLMEMGVPPATVHMMGALMTGQATNDTMASLMSQMSASEQATVMSMMPVSAAHVVVGTILHFAFAAFLGVLFTAIIVAAARMGIPGLRQPGGVLTAAVLGGIIVYIVMRWGLLPALNPMMLLVPQVPFFFAHVLYGLLVGAVLARVMPRFAGQGTGGQ